MTRFFSPSSIQFRSVQLFATPWTAAHQASLSITNSQSLLILTSIELVKPSNHLILLSPFPHVFKLSQHQCLLATICTIWPLYSGQIIGASASASVLSMNIQDWFPLGLDLLAVQGTLKESFPTPQFKSIKSSVLSFLYGATLTSIYEKNGKYFSILEKNIALTIWTFVGLKY